METKLKVGNRVTIVYERFGNLERNYPIVEVRIYPLSKAVLYVFETAPGHHRAFTETAIRPDGKVMDSKVGWHSQPVKPMDNNPV